jgi:phosphopantetheinyl transferase
MKYVGDDIKGITKIWSVKESSYKVGGETIPLNKINVKREGDNLFKSEVGNKSYSLNTIELNGHVISYTT